MSDAETSFTERLERLEEQVRRINEHLGLTTDDGDGLGIPTEVVTLARAGRQMEAIRLYTKLSGADITTATSIVNAIV
jgi:hypothetical protein